MNNRKECVGRHCRTGQGLIALVVVAVLSGLLAQGILKAQAGSDDLSAESTTVIEMPETYIMTWPKIARTTAHVLLERYGQPDLFTRQILVWYNKGPWYKTEVHREPRTHRLVLWNKDYLRQTVSYKVPYDRISDLKYFDKNIDVDEVKGELSVQSDSEAMNFLAVNLAEDIITGKRSVDDARAFRLKTTLLSKSGKGSPYLDRLLFHVQLTK